MDRVHDYESCDIGSIPIMSVYNLEKYVMNKSVMYNYSSNELQSILDDSSSYIDVVRKMGLSGSSNVVTLKRIIGEYNLSVDKMNANRRAKMSATTKSQNRRKTALEIIKDSKIISSHRLKERLIEDGIKKRKCEKCNLDEWMGKVIPLELHHKDGNHSNNDLDNLQLLCPNCHAQTDTYKGKNKS